MWIVAADEDDACVYALLIVAYGLAIVPVPLVSFPDDDTYKSVLLKLYVLDVVFLPSVAVASTVESACNVNVTVFVVTLTAFPLLIL